MFVSGWLQHQNFYISHNIKYLNWFWVAQSDLMVVDLWSVGKKWIWTWIIMFSCMYWKFDFFWMSNQFLFSFYTGSQLIVADWMLFISNWITFNSTDLWRLISLFYLSLNLMSSCTFVRGRVYSRGRPSSLFPVGPTFMICRWGIWNQDFR